MDNANSSNRHLPPQSSRRQLVRLSCNGRGFASNSRQKTERRRMNQSRQPSADAPPVLRVKAGEDRFGEQRGLGISTIDFKVIPQDSNGLLVLENTFHAKGGPARHLHYDQDEWFYVVEGDFVVEVGRESIRLQPGDSLLAPRRQPHVWAYIRKCARQNVGRFYARRQNGSFLPRSDESQRNAAARSRAMACSWNGVAWAAAICRVRNVPACRP